MKFFCLMFMLFLLAVAIFGQTTSVSSDAPNVEIIQKKWEFQYRNPALDEDPFRALDEHKQDERNKQETIRDNEIRSKQGKTSVPPPQVIRPMETKPPNPWTSYVYEAKFKNNAEKEIQTIAWDYVFFDPNTKQEVGRRQFVSKTSIKAGKTKTLTMRSPTPPTETVDAAKSDKNHREQYSEQIVIQRIEYKDGTTWKPASK
jgi:predicted Holliday junction resolvase-like endonuclease